MANKKETLEDLLNELDLLIEEMEEGEISLDESFAKYKKGLEIVKKCKSKIDKVEKEIEVLGELDDESEE